MRQIKVIVEKNPDCYVAYPLGLKGVVVGQGGSFEAALATFTARGSICKSLYFANFLLIYFMPTISSSMRLQCVI